MNAREVLPSTNYFEDAMDMAIHLSYKSARDYGGSIPVGAVATLEGVPIGQGFAFTDPRTGEHYHAEDVALMEAAAKGLEPDVLFSTLEACVLCQARMNRVSTLTTFVYLLKRTEIESLGLVNQRPSIVESLARGEFNSNIWLFDDSTRQQDALIPLHHTSRDLEIGDASVEVNREGFLTDIAKAGLLWRLAA